jgi:hypothetical protein
MSRRCSATGTWVARSSSKPLKRFKAAVTLARVG